jgi:antitoxin MazE
MKSHIIKIGNSQGIRIPKPLLAQAGLHDEIEIEVQGDTLVIRAVHHPRAGWEEAFAAMAAAGDDRLLDGDQVTNWDLEEWEWSSNDSKSG